MDAQMMPDQAWAVKLGLGKFSAFSTPRSCVPALLRSCAHALMRSYAHALYACRMNAVRIIFGFDIPVGYLLSFL